jgi:hypothetical protein
MADVGTAFGDRRVAAWQEPWKKVESILRDAIIKADVSVDFAPLMSTYTDAARAERASGEFVASLRRLEVFLKC